MINTAICDDDNNVVDFVRNCLSEYFISHSVKFDAYTFSSGESLIKNDTTFDLIFLDIEMTGMDGIKTAQLLRFEDRKVKIVYITSHSECALQGYTAHPFDFLVKPINKERIIKVLDEFLSDYSHSSDEETVVEFKGESGTMILKLKDIYAIEYTGNRRVTIFTKAEQFRARGGISEILKLINSDGFICPHKSFIINMEYIQKMNNFTLYTTNGLEIPIAQKKLKVFQKEFSHFIKKYIRQE